MFTALVQEPQTGDVEHVVWMEIGRRVQYVDSVESQHRIEFVQLQSRRTKGRKRSVRVTAPVVVVRRRLRNWRSSSRLREMKINVWLRELNLLKSPRNRMAWLSLLMTRSVQLIWMSCRLWWISATSIFLRKFLLHHLGTVLASCLSATALGLSKYSWDVEHVVSGIGNWALRTVCKWSKSFMRGGAYGRRSSGFWSRVHLEFAYVAGCSLLVRHQGSHAWQSCAETLMVVGLVLASRSACVILNSLCSGIATWSHFCPITSTCFVLHVFLCAVSWGLSGRVWLRTWYCLEVRVRLNCLCGACSNCNTLGGLLSSVLVVSFLQCSWGDSYYKFSPGFALLFVPSVGRRFCTVLQCCGTRCSLWFSAPVCTLVRLLVDVDGGWAHAFCLFTEGLFGVTSIVCIGLWYLIRGVPSVVMQESAVLSYVFCACCTRIVLRIQWYVATSAYHVSSESDHPRLMESDDVVCFSQLVVPASFSLHV